MEGKPIILYSVKAGREQNKFLSLKIVFIFANSADPDEMPHYAAFHLGLHCLPINLFIDIQNEKS